MSAVLREIIPKYDIFAINECKYDDISQEENDRNRAIFLELAIDWAIKNKIQVLTYLHGIFSGNCKQIVAKAISKAAENGIITTFIYCDSTESFWPYDCMPFNDTQNFSRIPDSNIWYFDYNHLLVEQYERYSELLKSEHKI